jgi:uncharacterized membrane protein
MTIVLALLIGVIAGLRSMTAPAIVAWAAHLGRIDLHGSSIGFLRSTGAVAIFTLGAVGELIVDKLPRTPSRTTVAGLLARLVFGGLSGAAVAVAGLRPAVLGVVFGVIGAFLGAFGGRAARAKLTRTLEVQDRTIALIEDAVAIVGAILIVSRL